MPFCCQCGSSVQTRDVYCGGCGFRQPLPASTDYLAGVSSRTASLLCYIPVLGWLAAIVVLASNRFREDSRVRFHAFQGLYLFVAWLIADWVLGPMFSWPHHIGLDFYRVMPALCKAVIFAAWIFMMIKVAHDEFFKLPILGDLAEKSVSEQR